MNVCRTCLKTPANKHISLLEKAINEDNKNFVDIMMFCLDIVVTPNSKITTNLCNNCYRKIISFYKFKALSLKNYDYLNSLYPSVSLVDQEISVYVDENGIKHENSLDPDEFGPSLVEDSYKCFKEELDMKYEVTEEEVLDVKYEEDDTEDRQSDNELQSLEEENTFGEIKDEIKETAPKPKKRHRTKKLKQKVEKVKQMRQMCEECGKSVANLKEHSAVHQPRSERLIFQCKACPKLFSSYRGQKIHYKIKHLGHKFECDICHIKVVSLWNHKLRAHNPEALRYVCVLCERRCISQSELDLHMTSHTKVHAFECDVCHKKFRSKELVARHIRHVHDKVMLHQCHLCSKSFSRKDKLVKHATTHSTERPYECADCGKSFKSKDNLKKHQPIHGGVKAFRCRLCDKSFVKRNYLNAHMISHTKEKKHACQFCGVRFGRSDHRRRHEYTAHQKHLRAE